MGCPTLPLTSPLRGPAIYLHNHSLSRRQSPNTVVITFHINNLRARLSSIINNPPARLPSHSLPKIIPDNGPNPGPSRRQECHHHRRSWVSPKAIPSKQPSLPPFACADTILPRGIGLETSILFAKEGAHVLMADISGPALEKAKAKVLQLVPDAPRVETKVASPLVPPLLFH